MIALLLEDCSARRRPDLFGLGRLFARGGIGRVTPAGDCGFGGRDGIGPIPIALVVPASYTRDLARARAGYNHSSLSTFALTLRARVALPLPFTVCCQRVLQLPENVST